jgi:hypothetical protein
MKVVFAHPADVAHADQADSGLSGVTVRLRGWLPSAPVRARTLLVAGAG